MSRGRTSRGAHRRARARLPAGEGRLGHGGAADSRAAARRRRGRREPRHLRLGSRASRHAGQGHPSRGDDRRRRRSLHQRGRPLRHAVPDRLHRPRRGRDHPPRARQGPRVRGPGRGARRLWRELPRRRSPREQPAPAARRGPRRSPDAGLRPDADGPLRHVALPLQPGGNDHPPQPRLLRALQVLRLVDADGRARDDLPRRRAVSILAHEVVRAHARGDGAPAQALRQEVPRLRRSDLQPEREVERCLRRGAHPQELGSDLLRVPAGRLRAARRAARHLREARPCWPHPRLHRGRAGRGRGSRRLEQALLLEQRLPPGLRSAPEEVPAGLPPGHVHRGHPE